MSDKIQPIIRIGIVLSTLTISAGCTVQEYSPDEALGVTRDALTVANNLGLNGGGSNGGGSNGGGSNGGGSNGPDAEITRLALDVKTISSVTFNGQTSSSSWLKRKFVKALKHHGDGSSHNDDHHYCDADDDGGYDHDDTNDPLLGARATGKLTDGSTVSLRFEDQESFTSVTGDALSRYVVSFTRPGSDTKAYVCGKNNGVPIKAIPITGHWNFQEGVDGGGAKDNDPSLITFACQGFALYKCIDYGYPPWMKEHGKRLNKHHQACVRMIRADYCGDGEPWTVNGTIINLYDHLGIQIDTESWPIEAEWGVNGARCLSHQRIQNMENHPSCSFARTPQACGNPPQWGPTLLVSEAL